MKPFLFLAASASVNIMGHGRGIEVSKMRGQGRFRQVGQTTAQAIVNQAVADVLGADALPHMALIATAIAKPQEAAAQKTLRRFDIHAEKLERLQAALKQGYSNVLQARGQIPDATFTQYIV